MPVSSSQHRVSVGAYQNKFHDNFRIKYTTRVPECHDIPEEIHHFGNSIYRAANSHNKLSRTSYQTTSQGLGLAAPLLILLSQIRMGGVLHSTTADIPAFTSERKLSPSVSRDTAYPNDSETGFSAILSPVANALHETSQFITWYDPLRFPATDASPLSLETESTIATGIFGDLKINSYIITNEQKKNELISSLVQYLVSDGQLTADKSDDVELWLRSEAAGMPIVAAHLNNESSNTNRTRRALLAEFDPRTGEHIKEHCAFEEELLDAQGNNQGKVLLFQAQRAENPFRMIYDNNPHGRPSPEERGIAAGLNISTDFITLGIKPLIGQLIANAKRREYYLNQGDEICAERFKRLFIAEIATSLDVTGLTFTSRKSARRVKPSELRHALPEHNRAAFYTRNPHSGIRKEILLELKQGKGAINDNGRNIYLKPTDKPNEFVTHYPHAVKPELLERRVIVDENNLSWRYADTFDTQKLNVEISEGKQQIKLYGENYELHLNGAGKYEIVVNKASGIKKFSPVYMEPLSRTWHLSTHNKHPAFSKRQIEIIKKIKVKKEDGFHYVPRGNNNHNYYGNGNIYVQEKMADAGRYPWGRYVEMNGELIPVRNTRHQGQGVLYEVHDMKFPEKAGYPIEWDGNRWLFERKTSVHVSKNLKNLISPEVVSEKVAAGKLSAPDHQGLRWDEKGNVFLKIKNKFVQINKLNGNRFSIPTPNERNGKIILRFKKNKFRIETQRERLKNILETGLGGRKRKPAISILKEQDRFTESSARELLTQYQFPENGFYSDYSFALEIEQTGLIPKWADRFKKRPRMDAAPEAVIETILLIRPNSPQNKLRFNLGEQVGEGGFGEVFLDADDTNFLIKKYFSDTFTDPTNVATHEAEMFNRYYGEGAANLLTDESGNVYVRMYKVPGKTLDSLPPGSLPADAKERFVDMIEKLKNLEIIHNDIHSENILWDESSQLFYPIDINNAREKYFNADPDTKIHLNKRGKNEWNKILEEIEDKSISINI